MANYENALIESIINQSELIFCVLSGVKTASSGPYTKVDIKPVLIKEELQYQATFYEGEKVKHQNFTPEAVIGFLSAHMGTYFKQAQFFTKTNDLQILFSKKGKGTVLKKPPSRFVVDLNHNRVKQYLIPEGIPCDFMCELGVMDASGKVFKKKYDKFRQLNKYLEFVDDSLEVLGDDITIVDFGCGKAYLTFALYYYLVKVMHKSVQIVGLDLKEDVIAFCNETARKLNYEGLHFQLGDIKNYNRDEQVDMVVSLHACDTATDEALGKAVKWGAKVIYAVPCCQHELFNQLKNVDMAPLLEHGIVRDKLATIVTDTLRAKAIEAVGYRVQMLEFIDMTHTPKNILIRAIKEPTTPEALKASYERFLAFKAVWSVNPRIETVLAAYFIKRIEKSE